MLPNIKNKAKQFAVIFGFGKMGQRYTKILQNEGFSNLVVVDKKMREKCFVIVKNKKFKLFYKSFLKSKNILSKLFVVACTTNSRFFAAKMAIIQKVPLLLLEKPMAASIYQCLQILQMAKKNKVRISVNHQMRFMPQYLKIKKYLNSKEFGGISCMTVVGGNFGLAMNGIHYFEAFRFMTDEKPWRVMAWLDRKLVPNPRGKQFKDRSGCVIVETKSGKKLILQCSVGQGHGIHVTYAARNGWITVDELTGRIQASVRQAKFRGEPTTRYALPARNWRETIRPAELLDSTTAVIRALLSDRNRVTGEDGLLAVKVLVAAHMSAERGGRPVAINGRLDLHRKFPWA